MLNRLGDDGLESSFGMRGLSPALLIFVFRVEGIFYQHTASDTVLADHTWPDYPLLERVRIFICNTEARAAVLSRSDFLLSVSETT